MLRRYDQWKTAAPPDYAPAQERAEQEFDDGKLDFDETFEEALADGYDYEEHEGDYDRRVAQADEARARGGWREYTRTLQRLLPRTFEVAREAVVETRFNEIIDERGGRGW